MYLPIVFSGILLSIVFKWFFFDQIDVDMQDKYLDMKDSYVNIQDNYVDFKKTAIK